MRHQAVCEDGHETTVHLKELQLRAQTEHRARQQVTRAANMHVWNQQLDARALRVCRYVRRICLL